MFKELRKLDKVKTMTEIMLQEDMKYRVKMHYEMAKALVEGKVDSKTLRYAEEIVAVEGKIYEELSKG